MSRPDYNKPTMLESVYFNHTIRVQGNRGSVEPYDHLTDRNGEWHLEMQGGRVRIWNARRFKDGLECNVYTVAAENLASWMVKGDTVQMAKPAETAA